MILLETRHLTLKREQRILCRDLQLTIKPGQVWGILGANGSGKTTLLHTLMGLIAPDSGQIMLQGQAINTYSKPEIARTCGLLFQEPHLPFAQTVWEYCRAGRYPHQITHSTTPAKDHTLIDQALTDVGLLALAQRCVTTLSGGEKRRLTIAKLMVQQPRLYLLDEPTNHLDIYHQTAILEHFRQLTRQTEKISTLNGGESQQNAVIMAVHDINIVEQFCDYVLLLLHDGSYQAGRVREILTTDHLRILFKQTMTSLTHNNMVYWIPETA
jgi:iron complex transport system ATP-binding protein